MKVHELPDNLRKSIEKNWILIYVAVAIANLVTKFWSLPAESMFNDDAFSAFYAQQPLKNLFHTLLHDRNPPFYFILLHYWIKIFGLGSIYLKGLSVLFGTATALILLKIASRYINKTAGIIVSFLYLFSNWWIIVSHELRPYSLVGFLTALSFYLFLNTIHRRRMSNLAGLAVSNVLLLFTHYMTFFIPIVQLISAFTYRKKNKTGFKYFIISQLIALVIYLPWIRIVLTNIPEKGGFWLGVPDFNTFMSVIINYSIYFKLWRIHMFLAILFIVLVILNKKYKLLKPVFNPQLMILLLLWYALPILVDYFLSQYVPVFRIEYTLYTSLGLFLFLSLVFSTIRMYEWLRLILVVGFLWYSYGWFKVTPVVWEDWKNLVPEVRKLKDENTSIILSADYKYHDFSYYYNRDYFQDYQNTINKLTNERVFLFGDSLSLKPIYYNKYPKLIFVRSHDEVTDPGNTIEKQILRNNYRLCKRFGANRLFVELYLKDSLPCSVYRLPKQFPAE